jgi:FKBP-type peptidyl-prolyl cis-trans isomerase 2
MPVKKGDKVKVEYEGTLEDGTVFDSTKEHGEPLEFEVGGEQLMEGFENAVIGMETGDEKEFSLKPSDAYGDYNDQLIKKVPKDQLPKEEEVHEGMFLVLGLPNGVQIPAQILEVADDTVTIDLNHPLAGKELFFKVKILDIAS